MITYNLGLCIAYFNEQTGKILYSFNDDYEKIIESEQFNKIDDFNIFDKNYFYSCVNISINITKNCNLACKYCFNKNKHITNLSIDTIEKFIDKIINDTPHALKYQVDLSGSGEPLLEMEKILHISKFCSKKQDEIRKEILVMFVSNGYFLTGDIAKKLQENNVLFGVSLDGIGTYHDKYRVTKDGKPTFKTIIKNVKSIKNRDFVGCAMTISDSNVDILKSALFLKKHFNTISIKISRGCSEIDFDKLILEYTKLTNYFIDKFVYNDVSLLIRLLNGDDYFGRFLLTILTKQVYHHRCDAGIGKFSLDTDGNVYVCSASVGINELQLGTYTNVDYYKGRELVNNIRCKNCDIRFFCGNECLVRYFTNGKNPGMCKLKRHFFKCSLLIDSILQSRYPHLYIAIMQFLDEKIQRFSGDSKFIKLVEVANEYSFSELKRMYDFDSEKYNYLLEIHKIL